MTWIKTFEENEARGLLTWVYRIARWRQGRIPNIVKVSSLNPRILVALGPLYRTLLDAAHVAGFFSYMNRVVQALGADAKTRNIAMGEKVVQSFFSEPGLAPSE